MSDASPPLLVVYSDGVDSARSAPTAVAAAGGMADSDRAEVLMGWTPADRGWLSSPDLRGRTIMAGYALEAPVADGRLAYLPVRLSTMPRFLIGVRPDVAVVSGIRRGPDLVYAGTVGFGPAAARAARVVVVEVDSHGIDLGAPPIDGPIVATIERPPGTAHRPPPER